MYLIIGEVIDMLLSDYNLYLKIYMCHYFSGAATL